MEKKLVVIMKTQIEKRYLIYFRKYRIFFVFGLVLLCAQLYLAYKFLALENQLKLKKLLLNEHDIFQDEKNVKLKKASHELKLPPDKQHISSKLLDNNLTNKIKINQKFLNFVPVCNAISQEAMSALTRAHTPSCKEHIVNVSCLNQQNLLYPIKLQSFCPHSLGFIDKPKSLGCFKDDKILRLLPNYYTVLKTQNSPVHCAYLCLQFGFPYAGVEYSYECFCGKQKPSMINQVSNLHCNMKCPGDPKQSCGGYLTMNVFLTGIKTFKSQKARNFNLKNIDEIPVRIAYLLTVNGRAVRQVKRLINILYNPSHIFYIHVDARQDYMHRELLEVERNCKQKNIIVAKGPEMRYSSIWGGASLLTTFLTSARQMLLYKNKWDFLVNLSESDYPISTNTQLVEFLSWNKGMNFVKSHGRELQRFLTKQGLDKTFVECDTRMWRIGERKLPYGLQIDGGSDWVVLSRDFIEYITQSNPDLLVAGLLRVFKYTLLPAESFFHTVLRNSRFCDTYIDNNLHVANWKRKLGCRCQYKAIVDWCGCSPNDFKLTDFNKIKNTANKNLFFARKFEPVIDQRIINHIDQWMYPTKTNTTLQSTKSYDKYWQSLYHQKDTSPLADDTILTVSNSLARIVYKRFHGFENSNYSDINVLETTAYFNENRFAGILVHATLESSTFIEFPKQVEALIYQKRNLSTNRSWSGKIRTLAVNTEYDQKEQIFRNFLGGIGPHSNPVLAYEFNADLAVPQNFSVLWLDPIDRLIDVNHLKIEESILVGHVKPQLRTPLMIGVWQLLIAFETTVIAKLNFLITPLSYWMNQPINYDKARTVNRKPMEKYYATKKIDDKWNEILKPYIRSRQSTFNSIMLQTKIGWQLDQWIDSLINEHYEVIRVCNASKDHTQNSKILQQCENTNWSSLAYDAKSDMRSLY